MALFIEDFILCHHPVCPSVAECPVQAVHLYHCFLLQIQSLSAQVLLPRILLSSLKCVQYILFWKTNQQKKTKFQGFYFWDSIGDEVRASSTTSLYNPGHFYFEKGLAKNCSACLGVHSKSSCLSNQESLRGKKGFPHLFVLQKRVSL